MAFLRIFKATLRDVSRDNRFLIWLPGIGPDLIAHCINANIPGQNFSTNISYDPGSGAGQSAVPYELPYDITQNECTMTFMLDDAYRIKSYFDRWMEEVFEPESGFGYLEEGGGEKGYGKDIKIIQLSRQNIPTYTVTLTKAYPKSVSDIVFEAGAQNTFATFTVSMVYNVQRRTDTLGFILDKLGVERPSFI